jgi:RHH-type rel operon transcriptional repressor/antitoxin RelB
MDYSMSTLCVRIPEEIDKRLESLSSQTGRTKTYYVREAIINHLEEMEDIYIALKRLEKPGKTYSLDEVEQKLDLDS